MVRISEFVLNYVLNSAWQVAVIWIVAALGAFLLKNGPARYRHLLWLVALAACVVVPLVPPRDMFSASRPVIKPTAPVATGAEDTDLSVDRVARRPGRTQILSTTSRTTLFLTLGYFLFLIWRGIRLVRFWLRKERLRRSAALDVPLEINQAAQRCRAIFNLPRVQVGRSSVARVPYTIGARRPLIILPEVFCGAGDDRLLSIIGHEMAHVSRRDYLSNLLCELVALPISFHPLAFLIKRQIDRARELACDELVSKHLLPPKLYARSLVWAADVSMQPSQAFMLSMFDGQSLEERVMRLTRNRTTLSRPAARAIMLATFLALCISALSISMFSFEL